MRRLLALSLLFYSFCIHAQNWDLIDPFPGEGRDDASVFVIDNFAYCGSGLATGWITVGDFHRFDLETESWQTIAPLLSGKERQYACGFSRNGKGYLFGGYDGSTFLNDLYEYDPIGNTWNEKELMPAEGRGGMSCFVLGDTAYIVGGRTSAESALDEVWAYDFNLGSWSQKNSLPFGKRWRSASVTSTSSAFILGGRDETGTPQNDLHVYAPVNDSWQALSNFPSTARYYAAAWIYNDKIYYGFGFSDPLDFYKDLWVYSIATDEWSALDDFPQAARRGGLSFSGPNGLYYTTGVTDELERTSETWRYEPLVNLNDLDLNRAFFIYPNPVRDMLTIESENAIVGIELFTMQGKRMEVSLTNQSLSFEGLDSGIYLLVCAMSDGAHKVIKILKEE
jgi:N-acetylneuraminic acid mutarotase